MEAQEQATAGPPAEADNAAPERILVVDGARDVAAVLQKVLTEEGYEAPTVVNPADVVGEVCEHAPDAVALHLPPSADEAGAVLDAIRVDPATRGVPVLATSTVDAVADAAKASYNVQETLGRPFDLDDLLAKLERTLSRPPVQALVPDSAAEGVVADAEAALAAGSRVMLLRLAERLRASFAPDGRRAPEVGELLGDAPTVVDALDASLRLPEPAALLDEHPAAAERLLSDAAERAAQGADGAAHARELALLREEVWALLSRELPREAGAAEVAELERVVNASLDRIEALTRRAYDQESRPSPGARGAGGARYGRDSSFRSE
jgi:CheY-like chemotaxis protein